MREGGAYTLEFSLALGLLVLIIFETLDFIAVSRYASGAQWVSLTAARVALAETPSDREGEPPKPRKLKLPPDEPGLSYIEAFCGAIPLSEYNRRVLNLALGETKRVFGTRVETPKDWDGDLNSLKEGEIVILPYECPDIGAPQSLNPNCDSHDKCTAWRVCIKPNALMLSIGLYCYEYRSEPYKF